MKKIVLGVLCLMVFYSCSDDNLTFKEKINYSTAKINLLNKIKKVELRQRKLGLEEKNVSITGLEFTEEEKATTLESSINVLNSQEISNEVIVQEFGDLNNPEIILTALAMTRIIDETNSGRYIIDLETGYNYSTDTYIDLNLLNGKYLAKEPTVLDCAMDALGIPAGLILGSAKNLTQGALLKAAKKLATRTLGWIGAGIAIYEFGDCMEWW